MVPAEGAVPGATADAFQSRSPWPSLLVRLAGVQRRVSALTGSVHIRSLDGHSGACRRNRHVQLIGIRARQTSHVVARRNHQLDGITLIDFANLLGWIGHTDGLNAGVLYIDKTLRAADDHATRTVTTSGGVEL